MKLTKQDETLIRDLEEFANDSDVNETGIYTKILDFIRRLQSGYSSASTASDEWKVKYEAEREENIKQKAEIERLTKAKRFATRKMMESKAKAVELQKQAERLTGELDKATESLVTASRCFTQMETFYKNKCQEFETAKEKDAADSKQHCEKCRTYWLSKLDAQKARNAQLQKQVEELKEQKGFWEGMHDRVCSKLEEYDDKSEEYENALVMKQCRITELQKQVDELTEERDKAKSANTSLLYNISRVEKENAELKKQVGELKERVNLYETNATNMQFVEHYTKQAIKDKVGEILSETMKIPVIDGKFVKVDDFIEKIKELAEKCGVEVQ